MDFRLSNIVENAGFSKRLLEYMDSRYKVSSWSVFCMNIVPAIFQEVKMALKDDIRWAIGPFSFTTDMWKGLTSEFMCVTLNWPFSGGKYGIERWHSESNRSFQFHHWYVERTNQRVHVCDAPLAIFRRWIWHWKTTFGEQSAFLVSPLICGENKAASSCVWRCSIGMSQNKKMVGNLPYLHYWCVDRRKAWQWSFLPVEKASRRGHDTIDNGWICSRDRRPAKAKTKSSEYPGGKKFSNHFAHNLHYDLGC